MSALERARELAREAGLAVVAADLGSWNGVRLCAEFDPARRRIAIDLGTCEALAARFGAEAASEFLAVAIAHETAHAREFAAERDRDAARPARSGTRADAEARAHAFVRERLGLDPERSEARVRAAAARANESGA